MKILIFQRILPHYRLNIFRELHKETGAILCIGKNGPADTFLTKVAPDFEHLKIFDFYPYRKKDTLVIQDVLTPLLKYKPDIIIIESALAILSNWLLFALRQFLKYKLILWTHGYNKRTGFNPKYFRNKLRIWLLNKADAVIIYSNQGKAIISKYLKNPEKVFVASNTLDTQELIKLRKEMEEIGKEDIKKQIGFNERYNLIYIGRILKEKEPGRLIDVFKIITKRLDSVGLHFVGNGPLIRELRNITQGLRVKFWGDITDDYIIKKLLFASDLMVIPGYLGLSVVHSFCFDRPVVSQKEGEQGPFHSPEVEYVVEGKTGFLTEYGNNELMADTIINYLKDEKKQLMMKEEIRSALQSICNVNNMMEGFKKALEYVNKDKQGDNISHKIANKNTILTRLLRLYYRYYHCSLF